MNIYRLIFNLGLIRAARRIRMTYGEEFAKSFKRLSREKLPHIIAKTPSIGKTVFSFNYAFTPAYIAWYLAAVELGLTGAQTDALLWLLNDGIIRTIPKCFSKIYERMYLYNFRKKAPLHEALAAEGKVHPYDYLLSFKSIDERSFGIDITRCGMMTLARDFDAMGIFPAVCRVDYLLANYVGMGFERTKTLGDGDECCNCRYTVGGSCEWSPEKGFDDRK